YFQADAGSARYRQPFHLPGFHGRGRVLWQAAERVGRREDQPLLERQHLHRERRREDSGDAGGWIAVLTRHSGMTIYRSPHAPIDIPATPVTEFVLARARERGNRAALIDSSSGRTITYAQLPELVDRAAASLTRL